MFCVFVVVVVVVEPSFLILPPVSSTKWRPSTFEKTIGFVELNLYKKATLGCLSFCSG